jgi:hypothetical protein
MTQMMAAGGKTTDDVDEVNSGWHGRQLMQMHLHQEVACINPNALTCAFCHSPADGVGGGGDAFDDDGGGDAGHTASWNDTIGSPQQSFQTQGTSAMQASEASQVLSAIQLAQTLLQDELERHLKNGYSDWLEVCLFYCPKGLKPVSLLWLGSVVPTQQK